MPRLVAFLRAINVGRGRTVKMEPLRRAFQSLHFLEVATFGSSGNVVFATRGKNTWSLEEMIENGLRKALGFRVAAFVRTEAELVGIVGYRPFRQTAISAADQFNIIFLQEALDENLKRKVMRLRTETDEFRVHGREIYWLRRKRKSGAGFSNVPLAKAIDTPFTIRGAKTVREIANFIMLVH